MRLQERLCPYVGMCVGNAKFWLKEEFLSITAPAQPHYSPSPPTDTAPTHPYLCPCPLIGRVSGLMLLVGAHLASVPSMTMRLCGLMTNLGAASRLSKYVSKILYSLGLFYAK